MKHDMVLVHDNESKAVPIPAVRDALEFMRYASAERVMFGMLYYTGCRPSELDGMSPDLIYENTIYWYLGKNQRGKRKEVLPEEYLGELWEYRRTHRVAQGSLFGISHHTFRRYFNRDIRPFLGSWWHERRLVLRSRALKPEYVLQLKGLRKTWQTMLFAKEWSRWEDAGVALEFTSKRMQHSSKGLTVTHYLENFDSLQLDKHSVLEPIHAIKPINQLRVFDF